MSKVGVSTYFDMQSPLESVLTRAVEELGVECVEILSDGKHDITRVDTEVCESFELTYSVHAPMESNLASLREVLRRAAVEQIGEVLTAAAGIEAKVVVVHPGYFMWDYEEEEAYEACRTSLHTLEGMQKEYGITIAVENMTGWGNTILTQPEHLDVLGGLGMTLDVGHANVMGRLYDFLESERIVHAHIHDNHGEDDEHAPLGTGNIDFKRVFQKLDRLSILCILEMSSIEDAKTSLTWLSKNGMKPSSYIEQHR
ncbi:MAG: sugar phosphate isomerase/epimerase family protein [Methermicoccaceae archaeon]